jgi:large subunit ribosomal protein L29
MSDVTKATDLRGQTDEELGQFIKDKEEELFRLKFQHYTGQLENTGRLRTIRREIARARTIQTEKSRQAQ